MKKFLFCLFALPIFSFAFAATWTINVSPDNKVSAVERVPPIQTPIQYTFSESGVKSLVTQKNTLLQLNCNWAALLQSLWFGSSTRKLFSVGIEESWYEYTFDVKNCSLRGNKIDANYNYTKTLTEKEALAFAETFMKNWFLKDKVFYQLGKAFVLYKNSNGPVYPMMKDSTSNNSNDLSDIEIDPNDTGADIVPEYTSFSIMYPYVINGQEVREQYGSRVGMTLEISADGVMSVNARLLPFKAAKRNSEKLSGDDAVRILKNGWNSPFYGQTSTTVQFAAPQKVLVLFNLRRDNKTYLYLSSGIGLKSDIKQDQYAQQPYTQQPYTMILSDYKIGNNAQ